MLDEDVDVLNLNIVRRLVHPGKEQLQIIDVVDMGGWRAALCAAAISGNARFLVTWRYLLVVRMNENLAVSHSRLPPGGYQCNIC